MSAITLRAIRKQTTIRGLQHDEAFSGNSSCSRLSLTKWRYFSKRLFSGNNNIKNSSSITTSTTTTGDSRTKNPWEAVVDPKGSGLVYYWNPQTNETTTLGSIRPEHWIQVIDPSGSSRYYWWNTDTNETTALDAPKPTTSNAMVKTEPTSSSLGTSFQHTRVHVQNNPSFTRSMVTYAALGAGMTLGMVAVRAIFGI